jgi:ubiquinone/menaquinone biosynthesis C-methylase UbiE
MAGDNHAPSFKDMERDGWHERASIYDDNVGRLTSVATGRLLDAVGASPLMRLLDVCCGPGYGAGEAAARGLTAVGIDIAPGMIAEARHRFPAAEFRVGDAEALEFADASFDAVICPFGLLHLPEPDKALSEAFRILKPGGRYAFTVWCSPDKAQLLGLALKATLAHADMTVPLPPAPPMFQFSDPALSTAALERVGFKVIMSEEIPITYRGQNAEGVFEWYEKIAVVAWPSSVYKLLRSNSAFGTQLSMEHAHILPAVASQFPAQR